MDTRTSTTNIPTNIDELNDDELLFLLHYREMDQKDREKIEKQIREMISENKKTKSK